MELSHKVFPSPLAWTTGCIPGQGLSAGLTRLVELSRRAFEFEALELESDGTIFFRIGGDAAALESRIFGIEGAANVPTDEASRYWTRAGELEYSDSDTTVKIPTTPSKVGTIDAVLAACGAERRYSAGANVCYATIDARRVETLGERLNGLGMSGILLRGLENAPSRIGRRPSAAMEDHVKMALDPNGKFPAY